MNYRGLACAVCLGGLMLVPEAMTAETQTVDIYPDTWVAIDGLKRVLPTADEHPFKSDKDRTVGIFYVSWHYDFFYTNFKSPYASDVTKILQQDPSARLDYNHKLWLHEFAYHWGEPELGYFTSGDEYVIRKDISMLTDAGVDVLILDFTNGTLYPEAWDKLFETMTKMKAEGNVVPKFCFWGYNDGAQTVPSCVNAVYQYYYAQGKYKDLWFYWDGKPLLLYNEEKTYPKEIKDFFTLRHMWWGYYYQNGKRYVGSEDHWSFGYDMHDKHVSDLTPAERAATHKGRYEQMCVTPAQHASTMVGKSWTVGGKEPTLNQYDLPNRKFINKKWVSNPEYLGLYFKDRWNEALSVDPDFIYINDWNEWIAGQFATYEGCNFMGRANSNFQFVDQYNAEFNRTIQPMKGGGTDNYYMQMIDGIRRYKGVREAPKATKPAQVDLNSDFAQWDNVAEKFLDTPGDVTHRDHTGYGGNIYKNNSGRNDILVSKANVNDGKITFYVETAKALTPYTDPNWMLLMVNSDCDFKTGWNGFDYLINKEFASGTKTCIMKWDAATKQWVKSGEADFRTSDRYLVVETTLASLGLADADKGNFYFKWADNPADLDDAISLCVNGDTAPNRRFCYNYRWEYDATGLAEAPAGDDVLKATPLTGNAVRVESDSSFTVTNLLGSVVASGRGSATVTLPSDGMYIVSSATKALKVLVR